VVLISHDSGVAENAGRVIQILDGLVDDPIAQHNEALR
jgi:ABC-type lipoprotein export system ATPase subunit